MTVSTTRPIAAEQLERFAYVASHDMAEPLRMISGYLDLIRETYEGRLDADFEDYIALAIDGADRMLTYLESMRTYSRIGRLEKEREHVELRDLVDEVLTRLGPEIEQSGAEISVCPLPALVCERGQMTIVLQSLISNAIKFSAPDRPQVDVFCEYLPEGVEIAVVDQGIGMEPADEERAFAMLERLNGHAYPGTGMGLAIARKAIERHGGAIWFEPGRPRGSVFRFSLPFLQTPR